MLSELVKRNRELERQLSVALEEKRDLAEANTALQDAFRELKEKSTREKERLEQAIKDLLSRIYGRRCEKIDPNQLLFPFVELAEEASKEIEEDAAGGELEEEEKVEEKETRKPSRGRKPLPKNLPRETEVLDVPPEDRKCPSCQHEMQEIGKDRTETLEYVPARFCVKETVRPKYACAKCQEGVLMQPLPPRLIEKGRPGPGLLAYLAVSKFGDHLPLHRLERICGREGVELSRSTMCDWLGEVAHCAEGVYDAAKAEIFSAHVVQSDDTPVQIQSRGLPGKIRHGYLWAYGIPWGEVIYHFTLNRSRDGPLHFIDGFRGYLQTDGYAGYKEVFRRRRVIQIGCMAHARRKFYAARDDDPRAVIVLGTIQKLYRIERRAKQEGLDLASRLQLRREEALPVLGKLREFLDELEPKVLPKSRIGKAIYYARNQWDALVRYVEVPEAEIDNNSIEQVIRPVAVGRKNWLHVGSEDGGKRAAILYSLIQSATRLGLNPYVYLRDIIERLPTHPPERLAELTPRAWKASLGNPEAEKSSERSAG